MEDQPADESIYVANTRAKMQAHFECLKTLANEAGDLTPYVGTLLLPHEEKALRGLPHKLSKIGYYARLGCFRLDMTLYVVRLRNREGTPKEVPITAIYSSYKSMEAASMLRGIPQKDLRDTAYYPNRR